MSKVGSQMLKLKKVEDTLLFLTLLFLPTQLGRHFWPKFSYIYSLKIDYLSPALYFWDILVIGLLIIWYLRKPKINQVALNLFLLFLLTQAFSMVGATNTLAGLVRLEQYLIAGLFGVYIASQQGLKFVYLPLALGVLGESMLAILQFIKGATLGFWILGERTFTVSTPGIAKFDFYGFEFLRPYATFPHPNVLAGFILIVLSIMYYVSRERQKIARLAMLFGGITIFLSMSRTAILAGFITFALLLRKKSITFITIIIFIIIILSPVLFTRFSSIFNFDNLTILRREELINFSWQLFLVQPIFGVGLNNFIPANTANLVTGPSRFLQPVHNIFLLELAETGIIGLVGFLVLIGYPIKKMYNVQCTMYNFLPWLIILFLGMFDHYFLTLPQGYRLLFLVWGFTLAHVKMIK